MRKPKYELKTTRKVLRVLDSLAKRHGSDSVRYAVKKWDHGHTVKNRLLKQKRAIRQQMREINQKLRG